MGNDEEKGLATAAQVGQNRPLEPADAAKSAGQRGFAEEQVPIGMSGESRPSAPGPTFRVQRLSSVSERQLQGLAAVLIDCVDGGASVSFMQPLLLAKALDFWRGVAAGVARGARALLVAEDDGGIIGTVQLILEQPENQPHRADLSKMLVHRRARRQGVGEALLRAAEVAGRDSGKSLLVLDTASADAERVYVKLGWQRCGVIPGYALLPQGGLCDTTYYYKNLMN